MGKVTAVIPDVLRLPLRDLPSFWAQVASELSGFSGVSMEQSGNLLGIWQRALWDNPKSLAAATFPPGSAVLERVSQRSDKDVLDAMRQLLGSDNLEPIEGKTVLRILHEQCPKPAKQKPLTLRQRKERVAATRRKSR